MIKKLFKKEKRQQTSEQDRKTSEQQGDNLASKWHSVYTFLLLFEEPVKQPEFSAFHEAMMQRFGEVLPMGDEPHMPGKEGEILSFALMDHKVYYKDKDQNYPSQLLLIGPGPYERTGWNEMVCSQFWACMDKESFLPRCKYVMTAGNMMATGLPMMEEYGIMAEFADLLLEQYPDCIGIYWPHSQCLTPREYYQDSHWNNPAFHFLDGGLNVRFFSIQNSDEMLFDTLGFTAIGLPDLQFHCKGLEPDDVVGFLRNVAAYLYENGDVIENGNTVEGMHHERLSLIHI